MTVATNARIAGFTFLFYIVAGVASMVLFGRAAAGVDVAEKLAAIAQHASAVRIKVLLELLQSFSALVRAVTLYAITREQDRDLALLAMVCRVVEGVLGALGIPHTLSVLGLATAAGTGDGSAVNTLAAYLLKGNVALTATFFAVGSALFAWLLLRGRRIPSPLAGLGLAASVLLVVGLPLQLAGFFRGPAAALMWLPMLAFEVPLALWLLFKGVAEPTPR